MAAYSYEYRVKWLQKAPAQVAGEIMEQLEQSEAGLSPASLLDVSRDENAPLHGEFEWRDDVAAEQYRLNQAGGIIRNVYRITIETQEQAPVRAFVPTCERQNVYVSIATALTNEQWRKNLLESAKRDMQAFSAKYRNLDELSEVLNAMKKVG